MGELHAEHVEGHASPARRWLVGTKPKRASGSMKRLISQALPMRSTPGRGRVTQTRRWKESRWEDWDDSAHGQPIFLSESPAAIETRADAIAPGAPEEVDRSIAASRCRNVSMIRAVARRDGARRARAGAPSARARPHRDRVV